MWLDSRHNQGLISWLAQESIDEHRGAGEIVNSPRLSFVNTKPVEKEEVFTIANMQSETLKKLLKNGMWHSTPRVLKEASFVKLHFVFGRVLKDNRQRTIEKQAMQQNSEPDAPRLSELPGQFHPKKNYK